MTQTVVRSLGNAGIQVTHGRLTLLVDPFFRGFEGVGTSQWEGAKQIERIDLILVTHDHWDHFSPEEVAKAVQRTGAIVVCPATVAGKLKGKVPKSSVIELEPRPAGGSGKYKGLRVELPGLTVTGFRTSHARGHTSYLVEAPGLRFLHDGDNEQTQHYDRNELMHLDALMLCPWQGSGWVEFIEAIKPRNWFLIHMTVDELAEHARGEFFPGICDHVPMEPVVLKPGESREITEG